MPPTSKWKAQQPCPICLPYIQGHSNELDTEVQNHVDTVVSALLASFQRRARPDGYLTPKAQWRIAMDMAEEETVADPKENCVHLAKEMLIGSGSIEELSERGRKGEKCYKLLRRAGTVPETEMAAFTPNRADRRKQETEEAAHGVAVDGKETGINMWSRFRNRPKGLLEYHRGEVPDSRDVPPIGDDENPTDYALHCPKCGSPFVHVFDVRMVTGPYVGRPCAEVAFYCEQCERQRGDYTIRFGNYKGRGYWHWINDNADWAGEK